MPWLRCERGSDRHQLGSLGSWMGLTANGPRCGLEISQVRTGESPLSLSAMLHSAELWLPQASWLGKVEVEVIAHGSARANPPPEPPDLAVLSGALAGWVEQQIGGRGVLAVPTGWSTQPLAATLLGAWADRGWRFTALETLVDRHRGARTRVITADGPYLRLHGPIHQLVMPNGREAAAALLLSERALERMLQAAGPTVPSYWRQFEQERQQSFVLQFLARKLFQALRIGAHAIAVGGAEAPLFLRPQERALEALGALHDVRFRVHLPRLPDGDWWPQVAEPGFLRSPGGRVLIFGLDWKAMPTLEIEGPDRPWAMPTFLEQAGCDRQGLRAHALHAAADAGEPLSAWFPAWGPPERQDNAEEPKRPPPSQLHHQDQRRETTPVTDAARQPPVPVLEPPPLDLPDEPDPEPPAPEPAPTLPPPALDRGSAPRLDWEPGREAQPGPPSAEPVSTPGRGLLEFRPQQAVLRHAHRPDSLRLRIDGQPAADAAFVSVDQGADGRTLYLVEGVTMRYGALVRVDFEPEWGDK